MLTPGAEDFELDLRSWGSNCDNVVFEMVLARLRQSMGSFPDPRLTSHFLGSYVSVATGENNVVSSDVTSESLGATTICPCCAHGAISLKSPRTVLTVKSVRSWR